MRGNAVGYTCRTGSGEAGRNSRAGHGRQRKKERSRRAEKKGRTGNGPGKPAGTETVQRNKGKEKEEHKNA